MKFRTDINGLRTYAVLAVIIFHFNKSWLPGGFAGVDVFFVISGYLMTSIIFRGLEKQSFSLWKFYSARIRRIIPALLVLIIILMIFGYLFLAPIPYADLAKHSSGSLLFISNIMYWLESGYFDASALEKFLLHTWSLSVEWQFYMIYPIALIVLVKIFSVKTLKKILLAGTILAFLFAVYASFKWSTASYFLLPSRIWEMLLGGVVFLYPLKLSNAKHKHTLELLGLALIVISFFIISENTVWPGYMALLPTMGAFILLQANNEKSLFTNNQIAQKIGLWSYSLYLYHWPIIVINYSLNLQLGFWLFVILTLLPSILSYYFIEIKRWNVTYILLLTVITLAFITGVYATNGASFRMGDSYSLSKEEYEYQNYAVIMYPESQGVAFNLNTEDRPPQFILAGDSFAMQYLKFIDDENIPLVSISRRACLLIPNYTTNNYKGCDETYDILESALNSNKTTDLILSQSWLAYGGKDHLTPLKKGMPKLNYEDLLISELEEIFAIGGAERNYYLVGRYQIPKFDTSNCEFQRKLLGSFFLNLCPLEQPIYDIEFNAKLRKLSERHDNVYFIDLNPATCNEESCRMIINNKPVHFDNDHLSTLGANIIGEYIFEQIQKLKADK